MLHRKYAIALVVIIVYRKSGRDLFSILTTRGRMRGLGKEALFAATSVSINGRFTVHYVSPQGLR